MEENNSSSPAEQVGLGELEDEIVENLRTVYDPELPVNIYDLGLIYELRVETDRTVFIRMTLTAPGCPAAGFLPAEVRQTVQEVPGVKDVQVELTWDPPYHRDMMSDAAKLELGLF